MNEKLELDKYTRSCDLKINKYALFYLLFIVTCVCNYIDQLNLLSPSV